jgi:signal peptide peptidase SppA
MPDTDHIHVLPAPSGRSLWAIAERALPRIAQAMRARVPAPSDEVLARLAAQAPAPRLAARNGSQRAGGLVAVLPLTGIITPRGSFFSLLFGGACGGLQGFRESFADAVNNPDVGAIVIEVDSPGGLVDLVPETAADLREARGSKPIIAVANTTAASAAYWLAAQADELVVTPSGEAGSIGVYMVHEDWSGFNTNMGVEPTYIKAGRYKTDGNPDEPLSETAAAQWQQEVDDLYAMFVADVAAGRNASEDAVRAGYGEGRTLLAARAVEAGLADRVDTIEDVIDGLLPAAAVTGASAWGRQTVRSRRADAHAEPLETDPAAEDDDEADEGEEQPRCSCGKWIAEGEERCEECAALEDDDDDDGEEPDRVDTEPPAQSRAALADVLLA